MLSLQIVSQVTSKPSIESHSQNKWDHFKGIAFPIGLRPINDILLSTDYAYLHCAIQKIKEEAGELITRLIPLGWTCIEHINGLLQRVHRLQIS